MVNIAVTGRPKMSHFGGGGSERLPFAEIKKY